MRIFLIALLLFPLFSLSQTNDVYIRLTDAGGKQINGTSLTRGYERWITGLSIGTSGKNNTQLNFTMQISGAAAELKKAMAQGDWLLNGQVVVIRPTALQPLIQYRINMEKIKVLSCAETMGCDGNMTTSVTLSATRIGWTYYQQQKNGIPVVSNKFGYDAETGSSWNNFQP